MPSTSQQPARMSELYSAGRPKLVSSMVKPYSHHELAKIYGVSDRTLAKWLVPFQQSIGARMGRFYSVLQVETIFACIGIPYKLLKRGK